MKVGSHSYGGDVCSLALFADVDVFVSSVKKPKFGLNHCDRAVTFLPVTYNRKQGVHMLSHKYQFQLILRGMDYHLHFKFKIADLLSFQLSR